LAAAVREDMTQMAELERLRMEEQCQQERTKVARVDARARARAPPLSPEPTDGCVNQNKDELWEQGTSAQFDLKCRPLQWLRGSTFEGQNVMRRTLFTCEVDC
jgi:hypothetical protein